MIVCWMYSLESPRWGDSYEYTQHTIPWSKKKKSLNICFLDLLEEFCRDWKKCSNHPRLTSHPCSSHWGYTVFRLLQLWFCTLLFIPHLYLFWCLGKVGFVLVAFSDLVGMAVSLYSRTSMARTSLGPWKFVWDMGSSSHWGLIMAPVQEANSDNLGKSFRFSTQWLYVECTH